MKHLTSSIHYEDPNYTLTIVVRQATAMDGMRRSALIGQIIGLTKAQCESNDAATLSEGMSRYWLGLAWAACRATTEEITWEDADTPVPFTREITFGDFQDLPDALAILWGNECMRLNPHWAPKMVDDDAGGAKQPATTSSDG